VSYNYGYKIKWLSFYCLISVYTSEYITVRTFCSTTTSTFYIYANKIILHAVSVHMLTPWHLLDVNLSPLSHIILAFNSGPPWSSNVCPIGRRRREHYRLSLTRPSWTSRTELSSETGITQCTIGFAIWLYRKTDNLQTSPVPLRLNL